MQIDRTEGLEGLGLLDTAGSLSKSGKTAPAADKTDGSPGSAGEASFQPYIDRAGEADDIRSEAVEEAKRLLAAGQLDTPENARKAAQNILTFGI